MLTNYFSHFTVGGCCNVNTLSAERILTKSCPNLIIKASSGGRNHIPCLEDRNFQPLNYRRKSLYIHELSTHTELFCLTRSLDFVELYLNWFRIIEKIPLTRFELVKPGILNQYVFQFHHKGRIPTHHILNSSGLVQPYGRAIIRLSEISEG